MINGRTYHGLSLNVDMDMAPFERISPCGYEDLEMTDLARLGWPEDVSSIGRLLAGEISQLLGYTHVLDKEATWKSST
jgi:lipoyl(octanoyl) transferase